jgi:hypothetical protein
MLTTCPTGNAKMYEKFPGKFQKIRKLLDFRNANHSTEIPGGKSNGTGIPGKKFPKIWVYLARLSTFPEIPENAIYSPLEISGNSNQSFWPNGKPHFSLISIL